MVNWDTINSGGLEYALRAFKHGIRKQEYEELFRHPFYKKKFKYKGELRYIIVGKAFGRYILAIATPRKDKIRIFSGREASEEHKTFYRSKYQK
ncbi:MAG: BrnT family toxin [Candidatus Methanoperedens sp.]|nr:BrnT family toxin [Candidatus Methanoperedens sp.]